MAEYAIAGVLQLYKKSNVFSRFQAEHEWKKQRDIIELFGKTVCIVGCRSVGSECAKRFKAFGCSVLGLDVSVFDNVMFDKIYPIEQAKLVFGEGDIVVLTLPLTDKTEHFKEIKTFWTFHDCWEFTSYCPHFTIAKCDKWKTGCYKCPQRKGVSWFFDRSRQVFRKKEQALSGQNMTILTPSHWLAELTKQSYLKDYPVQVINNGIDLTIFKPTESNFRKKYNIPEGTKILLAVSAGWSERKGFDVIIELAKRLDVAKYRFVVVGTDNKTEKALPEGVISIHRTNNQTELAEIYTSADVFVNPTREENYPICP